jgi:hypothetical protein
MFLLSFTVLDVSYWIRRGNPALALTMYADACTPSALCSEKSQMLTTQFDFGTEALIHH